MAEIIDGKSLALKIRAELKDKTSEASAKHGREPGLAVVLIGEDPASQVYVRNKTKACEKAGFHHQQFNGHVPKPTMTLYLVLVVGQEEVMILI